MLSGVSYSLKAACSHCGRYGTVDDVTLVCGCCGRDHVITAAERQQRDADLALWRAAVNVSRAPDHRSTNEECVMGLLRVKTDFHIEVGDEAFLMIAEIWPDGNAPENPTAEDVIEQIRATSSRFNFASDWGFDMHVTVDGRPVW